MKLKKIMKELNPFGVQPQNVQLPDKRKLQKAIVSLEQGYKELDEYYGTVLKTLSNQQQEHNPDYPDELPDISAFLNELNTITEDLKEAGEQIEDYLSAPQDKHPLERP